MSFIRPEAQAAIWRWRDSIVGVAVLLLGLSWALGAGGILQWIGWLMVVAGSLLAFNGFQRARFRLGRDGPGVVQLDEGQITYFGPLMGGTVVIEDMLRLDLDPTGRPAHWTLAHMGGPELSIPLTAEGADQLFDVFAALPGIATEGMLAEMGRIERGEAHHPVVIWQKTAPLLH